MTGQITLPNRRIAITERLDWRDQVYLLGVGFALDGTVRELFLQGVKVGSDMEAMLDDACILTSKLLQAGPRVGDLAAALSVSLDDGAAGPGSLICLALQKAAQAEVDCQEIIQETYRATQGVSLGGVTA